MAREEFLTPGKSKYKEPFRNFLYAFAVKLNRLLDEIIFHVEALCTTTAESTQFTPDLASKWLSVVKKEKKIIHQAQGLLEGHHTTAAMQRFDEAAEGLKELCEQVDELFVTTYGKGRITRKPKGGS